MDDQIDAAEAAAIVAEFAQMVRDLAPAPEVPADDGKSTGRQWGYDPTGRWTVKPVRGGVPDAPVERHRPGCGAPEYRCRCGPVDVERFQAQTIGLKMRGAAPPKKSMERGSLRPIDGSRIVQASDDRITRRGQLLADRDPAITLASLPEFDPIPPLEFKYADGTERTAPTSKKPTVATNPHLACQREQSTLHTRTIRAEHKLARAEARIAALEAEIERLKARTAPKGRKPKK